MSFDEKQYFADKTVLNWQSGDPIPDLSTTIPRFSGWDASSSYPPSGEDCAEKLREFLADPASQGVTGLVFGMVNEIGEKYADEIVEMLIEHREQLQYLTALFIGDISQEESEISWIELGDVSSLFTAFPLLEHFGIRGCAGSQLHFGILDNEHLKTFIVETGGMDRSIVHDVLRSHLPALEHLELWTGAETYGANCTVEDFASLFTNNLFPNLRYLGLRDSELANDLASALTQSSLLEQLRVLDLSLGLLDDTGATALLHCPAVKKLEKLDLHHHFCSQEMMQNLRSLRSHGVDVELSDFQEPWDEEEEQRYVAVSE